MKNYLTGLGLENFRVFKEPVFFDFAPITILTGANNSGKSSVMKALLLMKDNAKSFTELLFSGKDHNLGTFKTALNYASNEEVMKIRLSYFLKVTNKGLSDAETLNEYQGSYNLFQLDVSLEYIQNPKGNMESAFLSKAVLSHKETTILEYDVSRENRELSIPAILFFDELIERNKNNGEKSILNYHPNLSNSNISELSPDGIFTHNFLQICKEKKISKKDFEAFKTQLFIIILNITGGGSRDESFEYHININKIEHIPPLYQTGFYPSFDDTIQEFFSNQSENIFETILEKIGNIKLKDILEKDFIWFLDEFIYKKVSRIWEMIKKNTNFKYVEAVRANSKRFYTNESQGTYMNQLLLNIANQGIPVPHPAELMGKEPKGGEFFVKYWLQIFEIAEDFKLERIEGLATKVLLLKKGKWQNLADMGYGVTQLVPILLQIVSENEEIVPGRLTYPEVRTNVYLIEEPETNLHPKLQSKLADMLIDAWEKFGVRFIIETHSEYLIRKLQYWVAKKKIKPEDTSIYYLYNPEQVPEGRKQVEKLDILADGSLSNDFGEGFFDEATKWKFELLRIKNQN